MVAHSQAICASHRALLSDIAAFDLTESWRGDGAVSMAAWLTERCQVSGTTAATWVRAASKLETLPHLARALAEGALSLDAVAPLAEVAQPDTDADLADAAVHWTVKQIKELAASHRGMTDAAAARQFEHRSLRFNDAKATMFAAFTQDDYARAKAAMVARVSWEAADRPGKPGSTEGTSPDAGGYVSFDQRLYDAFVNLCRVDVGPGADSGSGSDSGSGADSGSGSDSGSGADSGSGSGHGTRVPPRFRPTLVVHADLDLLTGENSQGIAELAGVGPISREVARRLACDAQVIFSLERKDGSILDQKRVRRSPTRAQRIEIDRRDKGCRFPSCGFTDFTQVHHMLPWEMGGETNLSNLLTLCGRHHHAVHELGWSMKGNADGIVSIEGPHGHRMTSAPSPTWRRSRLVPMRR
jgi:Domain of unknown function (DUF222)/HNH endonuclease